MSDSYFGYYFAIFNQYIMSDKIQYMDTTAAYDLWSKVYDTDGNFLQALDTIEMKTLLPKMFSEIQSAPPWRLVDLGCGTGRNTLALLSIPQAEITAIDASPKMLEIAKSRLEKATVVADLLNFEVFDLFQPDNVPTKALNAHGIVSTLVIEHIPADVFFRRVAEILRPGGVLLLTNMHAEMGEISQAGFVDETTGTKIRPKSYAHTITEVVAEAQKHGIFPVSEIEQRKVTSQMTEQLGMRSKKWLDVTVWFGGIFRKH